MTTRGESRTCTAADTDAVRDAVGRIVAATPVTDVHTHLYTPAFGDLLLWGVDELLTYHYLIAETLKVSDVPHEQFWALGKREQADVVGAAIQGNVDALLAGVEPELSARKALQATELIFATWESSRVRGRVDLPLEIEDSPLLAMIESGEIAIEPA